MDTSVVITKSADVHLHFDKVHEAKALHEELTTWTPNGGWSSLAEDLFVALRDAYED